MIEALRILPTKTAPMIAVAALIVGPLLANHGIAGFDAALARVAAAHQALAGL